jgi:hypothetical protein
MKCRSLLIVFLLASSPAFAQTCPPFPARGVQIIDALYNPVLAMGTDDQRRALTRVFIEQLVFEGPGDGWTWKSADPGRPPSKDSIARVVSGRLCNWDWQNGGTRARSVQPGQPGEDITGQNAIPVPGVNHLSDLPGPSIPPGPVPATPVLTDLTPVRGWIDAALAQLYTQNERMFANEQAEHAAIVAQIKEVKEKPGAMEQTFSNRWVQLAAGVIGAILTDRYVIQ